MSKVIAVAALLALSGCVTVEGRFQRDGLKTASFDLGCPEEKIEMVILNRNDGLGTEGSKVGVKGCGKRTAYFSTRGSWIRDGEVLSESP